LTEDESLHPHFPPGKLLSSALKPLMVPHSMVEEVTSSKSR